MFVFIAVFPSSLSSLQSSLSHFLPHPFNLRLPKPPSPQFSALICSERAHLFISSPSQKRKLKEHSLWYAIRVKESSICGDRFVSERISNTDFQVMEGENAVCISPGKGNTGNNDVSVIAAEIPCALAAIVTRKRRSPTDTKETNKEEESPTTPKSEKHKIPVMTRCPPAPCKPRLTHRKRKTAIPSGTIYIPFDFPDLDLLFGLESKSMTQHTNKKHKKLGEHSI